MTRSRERTPRTEQRERTNGSICDCSHVRSAARNGDGRRHCYRGRI